jgi:hypothetical protein
MIIPLVSEVIQMRQIVALGVAHWEEFGYDFFD